MHAPMARISLRRCACESQGALEVPEGRYGELKWTVDACQSLFASHTCLPDKFVFRKRKTGLLITGNGHQPFAG